MKQWYVDCYMTDSPWSEEFKEFPVQSYGPHTLEECSRIMKTVLDDTIDEED
ncbi:hypothetical protein LCGC14_0764240 [marine sediment metagenome]|uniref:Uncharacterized protein n=1 Tax=marine sediment metagenome TaxID=412755 RepID=A0A0F9SKC7_9ZZZZ